MKDVIDVHTHTLASGHAYSTINEMAMEASKKGIQLLGITEHAPKLPGTCHIFYFENLHVVPRNLFGVQLLFGSEVNIMDYDGTLDLENETMRKLDVCIASIHPCCYESGTVKENTNAVIQAMKNPYIDIIGHPDDGRFALDYEEVVKTAKEYGVLLEINNSSLSPRSFRPNTKENDLLMLSYCKKYKVPVIMGSDAHICYDVGNHDLSYEIIREAGFPKELIMNYEPSALIERFSNNRRKK